MATVYLHIGTPKTGTTAIQRTFYDNKSILDKQRVIYPDFGLRYENAAKERNAHFLLASEQDYQTAMTGLKKMCEDYDKVILSEEGLWNNKSKIVPFIQEIQSWQVDLKLVVYVRRQDLYVQSHWAQHVKEESRMEFDEFVRTTKIKMDYYERIGFFADIIGKEISSFVYMKNSSL